MEGDLGITFLPSTDGAFDEVDVTKGNELAHSLQRVTQPLLLTPVYGSSSIRVTALPDRAPARASAPARPTEPASLAAALPPSSWRHGK